MTGAKTGGGIGRAREPGRVEQELIRLDALVRSVAVFPGFLGVATFEPGVDDAPADAIFGEIETPVDGTYTIGELPYDAIIDSVVTQCASGTCTMTVEVDGTPLGGTANSVSSTRQEQTHTTANVVDAGDLLTVDISANSSCTKAWFTVNLRRL